MASGESLTGDGVRNAVFAKPPVGKRGYDRGEVDAFMRRLAATLDGTDTLTADDVHNVVFAKPAMGDRGYREDEVDALLDVATEVLRQRAGNAAELPVTDAHNEPLSGYQIRQTVLRASPFGGYDRRQVDEFLARAADTLDGSGKPLSEAQIAGISFDRVKGLRRGYHVDEVDALRARITVELRRRSAGW